MVLDKKIYIAKNPKETKELGFNFAKTLEKGQVVCLYGDLGSGKTTFVQGIAVGLGIKNRIISPTFVIVRSYESGVMSFYHIDLYRTESEKDIEVLGIEEIINNPQNIAVIEWAEKMKSLIPEKRIDIKFSYKKNNTRKIEFGLTT